MTREEEIRKASSDQASKFWFPCRPDVLEDIREDISEAFEAGVQWAEESSRKTDGAQSIDWEQRRYEIARDVLPQVIQLSASYKEEHVGNNTINKQVNIDGSKAASLAVILADILVEELRKTEHHGEH